MTTGLPGKPSHMRWVLSRLVFFLPQVRSFARGIAGLHPSKLVFIGYLSYVVIGWIALCLPFVQKGPGVGSLDNLFVATSAMSTTGLSPVSIADCYNFFGQLIILILIQLGGIGYMTLGSFIVLARHTELTPTRSAISKTVFSLPASFKLGEFIKSVIWFTFVIEALGAAALYIIFTSAGVQDCVWSAIFHSVSSFCTAGFGLYNDSFMSFKDDFWLNTVIAALSYLGAIGFIVCLDFWHVLTGRSERVTFTTKIILWATIWLTIIGTGLLFISEPTIQAANPADRLLEAFFQCMSAMTTVGFNTVDIGTLSKASLLLIVVWMVIGSSPSGTGGGVKVTTISAMIGVMRSAMVGSKSVHLRGREIPYGRVITAFAALGFYLTALMIGTYFLQLTERSPFEKNLFEAASAIGTVGLSMGITATLTAMGKIIIILLMFCGRVGPLTFSSAMLGHVLAEPEKPDEDSDLAV
ncbi:MAG: potassium transporter TrkG [Candidatus Brocadiia bacterium]